MSAEERIHQIERRRLDTLRTLKGKERQIERLEVENRVLRKELAEARNALARLREKDKGR